MPIEPPYNPNQVYDIPMDDIFVDEEFNCRGYINPMDVIDLAKAIHEEGLHTPVFVEPWTKIPGKQFRLVAGYRRFKAHMLNRKNEEYRAKYGDKADSIRALIKDNLSDLEARTLNLSENLQRKQLNMQQEAKALVPFKNSGWTEQEVAKKLSMSRGWVQVRFMLLELPEEIQLEAAAGMLSQQQVRNCYAMRDNLEAMFEYVKKVKDQKLMGRSRQVNPNSVIKKNEKRMRGETEIFQLQDIIREIFGNGLATVALGWAAGLNDDYAMHKYILEQANLAGKFYMMPEGLKPGLGGNKKALVVSAD